MFAPIVIDRKNASELTTPSPRNKVASRLLIDRAATPPLRGGNIPSNNDGSLPLDDRLAPRKDEHTLINLRFELWTTSRNHSLPHNRFRLPRWW